MIANKSKCAAKEEINHKYTQKSNYIGDAKAAKLGEIPPVWGREAGRRRLEFELFR